MLLETLWNQGRRIRSGRGVLYHDMTDDEIRVLDEFEGEEYSRALADVMTKEDKRTTAYTYLFSLPPYIFMRTRPIFVPRCLSDFSTSCASWINS